MKQSVKSTISNFKFKNERPRTIAERATRLGNPYRQVEVLCDGLDAITDVLTDAQGVANARQLEIGNLEKKLSKCQSDAKKSYDIKNEAIKALTHAEGELRKFEGYDVKMAELETTNDDLLKRIEYKNKIRNQEKAKCKRLLIFGIIAGSASIITSIILMIAK